MMAAHSRRARDGDEARARRGREQPDTGRQVDQRVGVAARPRAARRDQRQGQHDRAGNLKTRLWFPGLDRSQNAPQQVRGLLDPDG